MELVCHVPINGVSFGQVSVGLLREAFVRSLVQLPASPDNLELSVFPLNGNIDMSTQKQNKDFHMWLNDRVGHGLFRFNNKDAPTLRLWHLNGEAMASITNKQYLISFHETDTATPHEINVCKNNEKVLFTSKYSCEVFKEAGVDNVEYLPLGFDSFNFNKLDKEYYSDDRISFNLAGKLEKRKHHARVLKAWIKKYGNNKKYFLNCALYNPFLSPDDNNQIIADVLEGKRYFNVNFLGYMETNEVYNDYLNSADVIIGMSGGEGWGLPEFQSVALGKHAVILNASGYKSWATVDNAVLVEPSGKIPVYDNVHFHEGNIVNQGNIFDFKEEDFLDSCDEVIARVEQNRLNESGLKLQKDFTFGRSLDTILEIVK